MTQNYKPAYPPEFLQQIVELVALGKYPQAIIQGIWLPLRVDTNLVSSSRCVNYISQATALAATPRVPFLSANERQELMELLKKLKHVEIA
ncbi:MAG: hypothetical protein LM517_07740 [Nitrosomonas sp.]|nr:hypothetical protein [Nitrosomonas sp.]